jgi:hypothetical protein
MDLREISPELVLVDPELAPLARLQLPEPGAFWASPSRSPDTPVPLVAVTQQDTPDGHKRAVRKPLLLLVAASLTLNAAFVRHAQSSVSRPSLSPHAPSLKSEGGSRRQFEARADRGYVGAALRTQPARDSRRSQETSRTIGRVAPTKHPVGALAAAGLRERPILRWKTVGGATYYDLVLWRHGTRVLDLWPTPPRAALPWNWRYRGVRHRLRAGSYRWFVYPGFGTKSSRRYGALAGRGVLAVGRPQGG